MVSNPNFYGQSTHGTPNQIEDGVDFPHTGIIKALSDGLGQNYAISGFDITIDSATQIDVGAGVIFRDGKRIAVAGVNNLTLSSTYTNGYHLLVANNHATAPVLQIKNPTAVDKVAEYATGDTIIAVITHNGTANVGIQYLTVNKTENSLSVGRDDSGYTESLSITSSAGDVVIEAKEQDKDIVLKVNDGGASTEVLRIDGSTGKVGIGETAPSADLHIKSSSNFDPTSAINTATLILEQTGGTQADDNESVGMTFTKINSGRPFGSIAGVQTGSDADVGGLAFFTHDASTSTDIISEKMRIDGNGNVGIGTASPSNKLEIAGNTVSTNVTATSALAGDTATITTALTNNGLAFNKGEAFSATLGGGVPTVPSFTTSIIYIHDATGNAFTLPPPNTVANSVFTIRNLGTAPTVITVLGAGKIDFVPSLSGTSLTTHRLVNTPDQIDLPVGDTVVVHAVADGNPAPLQDSYYIISP